MSFLKSITRKVTGIITPVLGLAATGALGAANTLSPAGWAVLGASILINKAVAKSPHAVTAAAAQGLLLNSSSTVDPLNVIYGERTVGGSRVFMEVSGTSNEYLHLVICFGEGEIDSYTAIYLDGVDITDARFSGAYTLESYVGTDAQSASAALIAAVPSKWTTDHKGSGVTYIYLRLKYNQSVFSGLVTATAKIKGRKLYDPRTGLTVWSANPALATRDYITNSRYGRGLTLTAAEDAFITSAANYCEDSVAIPGGTQARYLCNGVVSIDNTIFDNVRSLLTSFRAWLIYSAGLYQVLCDQPTTPSSTFAFTENNIVGKWSIERPNRRSIFNRVTATVYNPEKNWQPDPAISDSPAYRTLDNGLLFEDKIDLPFTANFYMGQQLAGLHMKQSRFGTLVRMSVLQEGFRAEVGRVYPITHSTPGWVNKPVRVMKITIKDDDEVDVVIGEYDDTVYSLDTLTAITSTPTMSLPNPFTVAAPGTLTLTSGSAEQITLLDGSVINRIKVSWPTPTDQFVLSGGEAQIQFKKSADAIWIDSSPVPGGTGPAWISPVTDGVNYDVRVRFENTLPRTGAWSTASAHTVGASSGGQIGGANLVSNTDFDYKTGSVPDGYAAYNNGAHSITWTNAAGLTGGSAFSFRSNAAFTNTLGLYSSTAHISAGITGGVTGGWLANRSYVVSFYARSVVGCAAWLNGADLAWNTAPASEIAVLNPVIQSFYQLYVFRITWGASVEVNGSLFINLANGGATAINDEFAIDRLMVQLGDVATEWSPETSSWISSSYAATVALANIASDNILSPGEKPAVKLDYDTIIAEQTGLDAQATAYSITTEKTTYDTAVTALTTYLGTLTGWNTIPGSDVTIVGSTFRSKFGDVYTSKQALINKIAAVAGTLATWSSVSGSGKPADNATNVTNTNQITDGANLGQTATWSGVSSVAVTTTQVTTNAVTAIVYGATMTQVDSQNWYADITVNVPSSSTGVLLHGAMLVDGGSGGGTFSSSVTNHTTSTTLSSYGYLDVATTASHAVLAYDSSPTTGNNTYRINISVSGDATPTEMKLVGTGCKR